VAFNVGEHMIQGVGEYVSFAGFWESVNGNECGYVKWHLIWDSM